jgi:hypothetical protein
VALGGVSWRFVEQPFRTQALAWRGKLLRLAATATLLFAGFSLATITSSGFSNRPQFSRPVVPGYTFDNKSLADSARDLLRAVSEDQDYAVFNNAGDRKLWFTANPATRKVLIIGNSHSMDLYNVFAINKGLFHSSSLRGTAPKYRFLDIQMESRCLVRQTIAQPTSS